MDRWKTERWALLGRKMTGSAEDPRINLAPVTLTPKAYSWDKIDPVDLAITEFIPIIVTVTMYLTSC